MRRSSRFLLVLAVLGLFGAVLTACGGSSGRVSITLYNGQHPETADAVIAAFEKATGITVSVRSNDEDTLADEIVTEGSRSPADVIWTENSPALEYLQGKGLLAKVNPSTLARIARRYDSPQGNWVGVSARVSVLVYNPSLITRRELPTRVLELASPRYRGKLAIAPEETDFQPIVTAVARAYGVKRALAWLAGIKSNAGSHVYQDNEHITDEVNRGVVAFGIVNQYYWYRMRAVIGASNVHSRIAYFAPRDPGYVIDVSGAAVLKASKHKSAAERFLAYLVGPKAQAIIAEPAKSNSFEYPLGDGVETRAAEVPFDRLRPYPITIGDLGDGAEAIRLLRRAGLL